MPEPYSPLRYPGGKSKISNFIIKKIQEVDTQINRYVEPYAGGAGAALRLLFEDYVDEILINDADPRMYCFWHSIINHNEQFWQRISDIEISVSEWRKQRAVYEKRDLRSKFDLGFATFYLNRSSRSGIIHNAGPIGGFDQKGNYKIDARFNRDTLMRRVQRIGAYSDHIDISCIDGLDLLKKLNRSRSSAKNTFVYLDPPYYKKGASLYLNCFTHDQHKALSQYLARRLNFNWILTYDNVSEIRDLYSDFPQLPFSLHYTTSKYRIGQELLIHPMGQRLTQSSIEALPIVRAA